MHNTGAIREAIEQHLMETQACGLDAEEALAETAGLLAEAEAALVRLTHPGVSSPPPARTR